MAPDFQKLREARNGHAQTLVEAFRAHASIALIQHRDQINRRDQLPNPHDAQVSRHKDQRIKSHLDELKEKFDKSQAKWISALSDKSHEAMRDLKNRLEKIEIDWFRNPCIGDCIDAVHIKWGHYGIASQGGTSTPVSEQISSMVASGATDSDFLDLLEAVIHMPSCLGGDEYRYCCLLATGLKLRNQGLTSTMEEVNAMLHWFDRANILMKKNNQISDALFSRLGS